MKGYEPRAQSGYCAYLVPIPIEIRPHVCTALAACSANKARLDIAQPDIIAPVVGSDRD